MEYTMNTMELSENGFSVVVYSPLQCDESRLSFHPSCYGACVKYMLPLSTVMLV